jgi:hypothetical protein
MEPRVCGIGPFWHTALPMKLVRPDVSPPPSVAVTETPFMTGVLLWALQRNWLPRCTTRAKPLGAPEPEGSRVTAYFPAPPGEPQEPMVGGLGPVHGMGWQLNGWVMVDALGNCLGCAKAAACQAVHGLTTGRGRRRKILCS